MSGFAVIACYSAFTGARLYSKSPIALDKFKPPFTRPSDTVLPAFVILSSSIGSKGLWSRLNSYERPLTHATALLSPALAQYMVSGVIRTTLAVQPAWESSSYLGPFSLSFISFWIWVISLRPSSLASITSILRKVSRRASSYLAVW